jgi:hypothetical protein
MRRVLWAPAFNTGNMIYPDADAKKELSSREE